MMKEKTLKNILYFLLIVAGIVIVGYTEYQQIQEDIQAQEDCRVQDEITARELSFKLK